MKVSIKNEYATKLHKIAKIEGKNTDAETVYFLIDNYFYSKKELTKLIKRLDRVDEKLGRLLK